MTTNQTKHVRADKVHAAELRQRDNGWGYALGYVLFYPGMFHASTRQTLTPIALGWFTWICSFIILVTVAWNDQKKELEGWAYLVSLPCAIAGFKAGIAWDRERSKEFLLSDEVKDWRRKRSQDEAA